MTRRLSRRGKTTSKRSSLTDSSRPASTEGRLGALAAEERARALDRPRAVLVLADHAGAGGEHGLAHQVGVVGRHEADQLEGVGGGRRQRRRRLEPEQLREHVGDAAVRLVEVGVRGDHGDAVPRRAQSEPACLRVVAEALERVEDERVVDEQQIALLACRLVEGGVVHLEGDQHAAHLVARRADLQPHVVPRLGQIERREAVDHRDDVAYLHDRDCTAAGGACPVRRALNRRARRRAAPAPPTARASGGASAPTLRSTRRSSSVKSFMRTTDGAGSPAGPGPRPARRAASGGGRRS